jgi:DICT domain-containing protein
MKLTNSLLGDLVTEYTHLRSQIYFKSSLTALARAMQDLALADHQPCLVIANFQQEKFFRQQEHRFQRLASKSDHVYILGVPDIESGFAVDNSGYETIPIKSTDTLAGERYLVVIGRQYSACLAVREKLSLTELRNVTSAVDQGARFEGIWSFEREIAYTAADWLLGRITNYRPELKAKTQQARKLFVTKGKHHHQSLDPNQSLDLGIFTQRLVTYLQTGQYKLLKAYKAIAAAERKESLSNRIASAQRSSLNPQAILSTTVKELGQLFPHCRCLLYQINSEATEVQIEYESLSLIHI